MGLRARLVILVLLALLPAVGVTVYLVSQQVSREMEDVEERLTATAEMTALQVGQYVEGTRDLLGMLALGNTVRGEDGEACSRLLARMGAQFPQYSNFTVVEADGRYFASGLQPQPGQMTFTNDLAFLQTVLKTRAFYCAGCVRQKSTKQPAVLFGSPVLGEDGTAKRMVTAALKASWLNEQLTKANMPETGVLTVFDWRGDVVARSADGEQWVGRRPAEMSPFMKMVLSGHQGIGEVEGLDRQKRLYAYAPAGRSKECFVAVGVSRAAVLAPVYAELRKSLLLVVAVGILALVAAWWIGGQAVVYPIRDLLGAFRRFGEGDYRTRAAIPKERTVRR